jgi:hypothetical protein
MFPSLRLTAKIRGGPTNDSIAWGKNGRSSPIPRDKQMRNTALALLDIVTEPSIAADG